MDTQEFKLEFLNRNQILNIVELYQLPVNKKLSTKKLLDEIKKYVMIDDSGEIVFLNGSPLEGGRKKLGVNIKVF